MIGQINRVYEVLNGKRPLTLQMIRRLHRELGIPAESLIRERGEAASSVKGTRAEHLPSFILHPSAFILAFLALPLFFPIPCSPSFGRLSLSIY